MLWRYADQRQEGLELCWNTSDECTCTEWKLSQFHSIMVQMMWVVLSCKDLCCKYEWL